MAYYNIENLAAKPSDEFGPINKSKSFGSVVLLIF